MNESTMIIHRCGEPSKQDVAEYGSICLTKMNSQSPILLYIQLSHIEDEPSWSFIGEYKSDLSEQEALKEVYKILHSE